MYCSPAIEVKARATVKTAANMMRTVSRLACFDKISIHIPSSAKMWRTYFTLAKIRRQTVRMTRMMKVAFAILTLDTLEDRSLRSNWLMSTLTPPKSIMFSERCFDILLGLTVGSGGIVSEGKTYASVYAEKPRRVSMNTGSERVWHSCDKANHKQSACSTLASTADFLVVFRIVSGRIRLVASEVLPR
jgi:hypothetical protein